MAGREPTFDPSGLTTAQRAGEACVVCHKKWPRPRLAVGWLPDGTRVLACEDCAPALRRFPDNGVQGPGGAQDAGEGGVPGGGGRARLSLAVSP